MQKIKSNFLEQPFTKDFSSDQSFIKLYYADSHHQLLPLFAHIYGVNNMSIKSHLILICGSETNKSNLEQMFQRAKVFIDTYMIVGINNLIIPMQEVSILLSAIITLL